MRRVITLLAATATVLLVGMGSAQAHSELISSSPAADSVLDFGPPGVELEFNQNIQNRFVNVAVTAPDGTQVGQGEPSAQGAKVLLPIRDGVGSGQYIGGYRVISEDGHPITARTRAPSPSHHQLIPGRRPPTPPPHRRRWLPTPNRRVPGRHWCCLSSAPLSPCCSSPAW